eukprot:1713818-Karenia_brevis.AAC.1
MGMDGHEKRSVEQRGELQESPRAGSSGEPSQAAAELGGCSRRELKGLARHRERAGDNDGGTELSAEIDRVGGTDESPGKGDTAMSSKSMDSLKQAKASHPSASGESEKPETSFFEQLEDSCMEG